jgi:hypothetical protein
MGMRTTLGGIGQVLLLALVACQGNDSAEPQAARLCDGHSGLRLHVFAVSRGDGEVGGSTVRVQHGHRAFAVDGACNYWVNAGWFEDALFRDREWRTGTLQAAEAVALEAVAPLANLQALEDCVDDSGVATAHVPVMGLTTRDSGALCVGSGARFFAAWKVIGDIIPQLWTRGLPLEGDLRLSAVPVTDPGGRPPYQWPLEAPVMAFVVEGPAGGAAASAGGNSVLVSHPDSTRKLRALRAQYLSERGAGMSGFANWDGLMVMDRGDTASIYMRDVLPYEDELGRWPF